MQPAWQSAVQKHAPVLSTLGVDQLPETLRTPNALADRIADLGPEFSDEDRREIVVRLVGAALALVAVRNGGALRSLPGEPVSVSTANGDLDPLSLVRSLATGEISADEWQSRMAQLGLTGRRLA